MTTAWTRDDLASLRDDPASYTPLIDPDQVTPVLPGHHLWDPWPLRTRDGGLAHVDGAQVWMALSAPSGLPPGARHDVARIRALARRGDIWTNLGPVFPDGESPGSREWAGCARLDPDRSVTVCYTAAGIRGEKSTTFVQRIFAVCGRLTDTSPPMLTGWGGHSEMVTPGNHYQTTTAQLTGEPGFIKAFRDPFLFVDPADGRDHVLFTASLLGSKTNFDGAVGRAVREEGGSWRPLPPLIHADGVNNELERPHIVVRDGRYYLFISTQARTFHPEVEAPTGLYGFVGDAIDGPWSPLNGSGLVLRNPPREPYQAYSWLVLPDLTVVSFVDYHSLRGRRPEQVDESGEWVEHFGGTLAPPLRLSLDGDTARLATP